MHMCGCATVCVSVVVVCRVGVDECGDTLSLPKRDQTMRLSEVVDEACPHVFGMTDRRCHGVFCAACRGTVG